MGYCQVQGIPANQGELTEAMCYCTLLTYHANNHIIQEGTIIQEAKAFIDPSESLPVTHLSYPQQ